MISLESFKPGTYERGYDYKYFVPIKIDNEWSCNTMAISQLLERAAVRLGELNSFSRFVPNIELFIQSHITKEAVLSSRIEGTQTRMDEAILPVEEIEPERRDDWHEVNNYIKAMTMAIGELDRLPISSRLIKNTHKLLLDSVRGKNKLPGDFRNSQNWIGGNSLSDAKFIPPTHHYVSDLMSDLEKFLNNNENGIPTLLKIAIAHYQFETIHPFLDGNGRIGRLMITLFLVSEGVLDKPLLYLSAYFDRDKSLYYDNLTNVRTQGDMVQWIKYFLVGIEQTATNAVEKLKSVLALKNELEVKINTTFGKRSNNGIKLLNALFADPSASVEKVRGICDLSYKAANDLVAAMVDADILYELTGNSRNRFYIFDSYLKLFYIDNSESAAK